MGISALSLGGERLPSLLSLIHHPVSQVPLRGAFFIRLLSRLGPHPCSPLFIDELIQIRPLNA